MATPGNTKVKTISLLGLDTEYIDLTKPLMQAVEYLNRKLKSEPHSLLTEDESWYDFDYPNYGGLPKSINSKLHSEQVDWLQEQLHDCLKPLFKKNNSGLSTSNNQAINKQMDIKKLRNIKVRLTAAGHHDLAASIDTVMAGKKAYYEITKKDLLAKLPSDKFKGMSADDIYSKLESIQEALIKEKLKTFQEVGELNNSVLTDIADNLAS